MSDYYFIRYENGYTAPEVQTLIDRGWLVPETEPLLTREEWETEAEHQHQWLPWLTLPNTSSWTQCTGCGEQFQYDY